MLFELQENNTWCRAHCFFTRVWKPYYLSYNIHLDIEQYTEQSSFQEYHRCTYIVNPHSFIYIQKYKQLVDRGWPLDSKKIWTTSHTLFNIEPVPHSFDLYRTTLHEYVPYRSIKWCCIALHIQTQNLWGNAGIFFRVMLSFGILKNLKFPPFSVKILGAPLHQMTMESVPDFQITCNNFFPSFCILFYFIFVLFFHFLFSFVPKGCVIEIIFIRNVLDSSGQN